MASDHLPRYLAFDLGASSSRAMLGTLDNDVMIAEEVHRFATPQIEEDGHLYWDIQQMWDELQVGLGIALREAPNLRSISVDSWGVDYVPMGHDGVPVRNPYCYRDIRTEGIMDRASTLFSTREIYACTGVQPLRFNTLAQVLADLWTAPDEVQATAVRLSIADYFNYRFSGSAVYEVSMASTTQLVDARTRSWSQELMQALGLQSLHWPSIVPSGTRLGHARQTDRTELVASCSHDTACAVAAVPASRDTDWAYISCGTWAPCGTELRTPIVTEQAMDAGFANEAGADNTVRFLTNLPGLWMLQQCAHEWQAADATATWDSLELEARDAGPSPSLVDVKDPQFEAPGNMPRRIQDYCRNHGQPVPATRGAMARLVLDSLAESFCSTIEQLQLLTGQDLSTIHLVGGGARNTLLCQLTANAIGKAVIAGPVEATALGNLLIQARTMDDLPRGMSLREVAARSSALQTYTNQKMP